MSKTLKIIGSLTSPFVRITRVVCEELDLSYEMDLTTFFAKNSADQEALVKSYNPLMRVPVLIDGETPVIDSRIIASYLLKNYGADTALAKTLPLSLQDENILTTLYGIIDAGVLWFIIKNTPPEIDLNSGYMARTTERLHSGLQWLNAQETLGQKFGLPEALLICGLDWFKKRGIVDWSVYPHLTAVHTQFSERNSLKITRIPETV